MLTKRRIILGSYDTAVDGLWTLSAWALGEAEPVTNYVEIPGRLDGPIDFTEALTGDVNYGPRPLEITLESSEGTRLDRKKVINQMVNLLHGRRMKIWLPDDADHYIYGRLQVKEKYNDPAHASVSVSATCEPWRYENEETVVTAELSDETQEVTLTNSRRPVYPMLTVEGELTLIDRGATQKLSAGTYALASLELAAWEERTLQVSGTGTVAFTYRKAVL